MKAIHFPRWQTWTGGCLYSFYRGICLFDTVASVACIRHNLLISYFHSQIMRPSGRCQIVLFRWNGQTTVTAVSVPTVGGRWYSTAVSLTNVSDSRFSSSRTSQYHVLQSTILAADTTLSVSKAGTVDLGTMFCMMRWHNMMTLMVKVRRLDTCYKTAYLQSQQLRTLLSVGDRAFPVDGSRMRKFHWTGTFCGTTLFQVRR